MAKTKWATKIQEHLKNNPLHYTSDPKVPCVCAKCGGSGKRVPLYVVTNYGQTFSRCYKCGTQY
jgi:hypothetical protein